jgi:hypothetical protein
MGLCTFEIVERVRFTFLWILEATVLSCMLGTKTRSNFISPKADKEGNQQSEGESSYIGWVANYQR